MDNDDKKCEELMKKIETETMAALANLQNQKGTIPPGKDLTALMQKGADEFKAVMGRNMTYGEMRDMYG